MQETMEQILYQVFRFNPAVAILELRTRLRGARPYALLFFFAVIAGLSLMGGSALFGYSRSHGGPDMGGGRTALLVLAYVQQSLIYLIMPAYAASSIALEREKRTIELLHLSLLSPTDIVSGKLLTLGAFAGMLLLGTLPVAVWCLVLGGVSPWQVFMLYTYLLVLAVDIIALGLFISTTADRAMPAVIAAYGLLYIGGGALSLILIASMAMATMGRGSTLGTGGAVAVLLLVAALVTATAYLIALGVRRRLARPLSRLQAALPVLAAAGVALLSLAISYQWLPMARSWSTGFLSLLNPRMALAAIIGTNGSPFALPGGNTPPGSLVWLLNLIAGGAVAGLLWLLAIANYRRRS